MPLTDGYGVLIGTISDYSRDPPGDFGKYYHGNLEITAPAGLYHCAIDVDSKKSDLGVEWRVVPLFEHKVAAVVALGNGYHPLASNDSSGAIDYTRSPSLCPSIQAVRSPSRTYSSRTRSITPVAFVARM